MAIKRICLISDSTGETLHALAQAVAVQFPNIKIIEELHPLIRSDLQLEAALNSISQNCQLLLYTLVEPKLIKKIEEFAHHRHLPAIDILSPLILKYSLVFGEQSLADPGRQHHLSAAYFQRIAAMDFATQHDDGMGLDTIEEAAVILLGVSRSSKSPTAAYLANRGVKVANLPFISRAQLPPKIFEISADVTNGKRNIVLIGLTRKPETLLEMRKTRLSLLGQTGYSQYIDLEKIIEETEDFKKLCREQHWAIIDVTYKSIEETAAHVMKRLKTLPDHNGMVVM